MREKRACELAVNAALSSFRRFVDFFGDTDDFMPASRLVFRCCRY